MTGMAVYWVGGSIHLLVGIIYGIIYALIFEPLLHKLPGFLSGAIYSLLPFIIAITMFGTFIRVLQNIFGVEKTSEMCALCGMPCGNNMGIACQYTHKSQPMLDVDDVGDESVSDSIYQNTDTKEVQKQKDVMGSKDPRMEMKDNGRNEIPSQYSKKNSCCDPKCTGQEQMDMWRQKNKNGPCQMNMHSGSSTMTMDDAGDVTSSERSMRQDPMEGMCQMNHMDMQPNGHMMPMDGNGNMDGMKKDHMEGMCQMNHGDMQPNGHMMPMDGNGNMDGVKQDHMKGMCQMDHSGMQSDMMSGSNFDGKKDPQDSMQMDSYGRGYTEKAEGLQPKKKQMSWLWSLINHLVYGVVLGMAYRPRKDTQ
ncbi:MAG: hypothetical protein Tsb0015_00340 [Simkaniaceae bacterium]